VLDRAARLPCARRPGERQHLRPDGGIDGAEIREVPGSEPIAEWLEAGPATTTLTAAQMSDTSDHHIPDDDIREAFELAVTAFINWDKGEEPNVTLNGEPRSISTIAVLAETFKEPMPTSLFWRMAAYANRTLQRTGAMELSRDSSYQTGARCLIRWVRESKSRFEP
jgi:hypothetical protein